MASIEKRGENSWRLIVEAGFDSDGKRIKRTRTIRIEDQALLKTTKRLREHLQGELHKFKVEIEAGEYIAPEKMQFKDFVNEWHEKYAVYELSPKTLENYMIQIHNRLIPEFGNFKIDQIKTIRIVDYFKRLQELGERKDGKDGKISSSTAEYIYHVLRNIFNRAVEWKIIKTSPMEGVKKPKSQQKEMQVYNEDDMQLLLSALAQEALMWRIMILMALTCGLRRGELLALEWAHIDIEKRVIDIKQSLSYVKDKGYVIKEPKTKNSIRKVSIPEILVSDLESYKIQSEKERSKLDNLWAGGERFFVFSSWQGKPLYPSTVKQWWSRFIKRHGLNYIRFHDLRHTSATMLINQGVHAKVISARLGHADIRTTMNVYAHVLRSADYEAAKHFDSLLNPNSFVKE